MAEIRIKCPTCGARLTVIDSPANQGKSVKCPICKEKHPFSSFQVVTSATIDENDRTQIGVGRNPKDATELPDRVLQKESGYLVDGNMNEYPLKEGINLIGRRTFNSPSTANVAIETIDRGFSRRHLYVEVSTVHGGNTHYLAYNAENKNPTTINTIPIEQGDKILLHDGDVIKSSKTILVFHTR